VARAAPASTVVWFRRDLRTADHPALLAAVDESRSSGAGVAPLFVVDDTLLASGGANRRAFLAGTLAALDEALNGCLALRRGRPDDVVPQFAAEVGAGPVLHYGEGRDRPDLPGTSRLSPYLRFGSVHPRQVLARVGSDASSEVFRSELAWREFCADVLWHHPDSAWQPLAPTGRHLRWDTGEAAHRRFAAWSAGRTGYPLADAGLRQLGSEGWMHNRVRMLTASFLVKDLHIDWRRGARLFLDRLVDGDLASNNHGWQWVAGTGTDAAPFHRIFNPVVQAERFDPEGAYVARYVGEAGGPDYPPPIVDHAEERAEALRRREDAKVAAAGDGPGSR
jgi:deoxyribodipyrimidine photolyase